MGNRLRDAVYTAAREELIEFGYREFRLERVAKRAGVSRSTLYRQWGTPTALARETIITWEVSASPTPPETGNWPTDLRAICSSFRDSLNSPEGVTLIRTLVVANAADPDVSVALLRRWQQEVPELVGMIERAQARADVKAGLAAGDVVEMIAAPFLLRAVITNEPADDPFLEFVYEMVLTGTRPR